MLVYSELFSYGGRFRFFHIVETVIRKLEVCEISNDRFYVTVRIRKWELHCNLYENLDNEDYPIPSIRMVP